MCPSVRFGVERWIERLRVAHPQSVFEAVADPVDASISYDSDPRRPRAHVQADRIQHELGERWWTDTDTSLDRYLAWLQHHPGWLDSGSDRL